MLPPKDLKKTTFSRVVRGYSPEEVDEHIDYIIGQYTEIYRENDELEQKVAKVQTDYDNIRKDSEAIRTALINAQRAGTNLINEANKKSDVIVRTAKSNCDKILAEFRAKIIVEKENAQKLLDMVSEFKTGLFNTYNTHLSQVDEICTEINGLSEIIIPEDELVKATLEKIKGNISEESERLLAEKSAAQIKSDANKEAERIIIQAKADAEAKASEIIAQKTAEAQGEADIIIAKAKAEAEALEIELNEKLASLRAEIESLSEKKESLAPQTESVSEEQEPKEEEKSETPPILSSDDFFEAMNIVNKNAPKEETKAEPGEEVDLFKFAELIPEEKAPTKEQEDIDNLINESFIEKDKAEEKIEKPEPDFEIKIEDFNKASDDVVLPTPERMNPKKGSIKDEIMNLNRTILGGGESEEKAESEKIVVEDKPVEEEPKKDTKEADDFLNTIFFNE